MPSVANIYLQAVVSSWLARSLVCCSSSSGSLWLGLVAEFEAAAASCGWLLVPVMFVGCVAAVVWAGLLLCWGVKVYMCRWEAQGNPWKNLSLVDCVGGPNPSAYTPSSARSCHHPPSVSVYVSFSPVDEMDGWMVNNPKIETYVRRKYH
ncbi:hypothetical protein Vafri_20673 [Volvox africanus]|uniref:Uncharacterized protein n=1 Tax=Volvox africanus TaxID=51714 RepID=A0A8J4BRT4_9CHLO|nr:hypothetical protein Vafri_20673 [Volvox africanus]